MTLPAEYTKEIKMISASPRRGFGSVKVQATIGDTKWKTSIFPDNKLKSYLLPVKKAVRVSESISTGYIVEVNIRLLDF